MHSQLQTSLVLQFVSIFAGLLLSHSVFADEYDALFKAKKYAEVERMATAKLATDPNDAAALLAKVNVILNEGKASRLDEGAKLAEQCIAAHPKHSECHEALGNTLGVKAQKSGILSAIGYVGKIRDSFKTAIEVNPQNFSARGSLMQFYLQAPGFVGGRYVQGQRTDCRYDQDQCGGGGTVASHLGPLARPV